MKNKHIMLILEKLTLAIVALVISPIMVCLVLLSTALFIITLPITVIAKALIYIYHYVRGQHLN